MITEVEENRIKLFKENHKGCIKEALRLQIHRQSPVLGPFTIDTDFSSGIGAQVTILCNGCGVCEDVTDYDCW